MRLTKGYMVDGVFIEEGSTVKVFIEHGESISGTIRKPSKREFRLEIEETVRVLTVDEISDIEIIGEETLSKGINLQDK
jgi:16S rRNA U1498 N3-methylase RsmE